MGIVACGGDDGGSAPTSEDEASASAASSQAANVASDDTTGGGGTGGRLVYADNRVVQDLDPVNVGQYRTFVQKLYPVFDALMLDAPDDVEMRIAKLFESDDGVHWLLKLREGVRFSDGTPLNAEAVRFNWDRFADPDLASYYAGTRQAMAELEVVDEQTLKVVLDEPNAKLPALIAATPLNFIASPTAVQTAGADFGRAPVGAGAFRVAEFEPERRIVYRRNDDFYGEGPKVDELVFNIIPDEQSAFNTLVADDADVLLTLSRETLGDVERRDGLNVLPLHMDGATGLQFNLTRPPFDDLRARQAMAYAIDRDALANDVYGAPEDAVDTLLTEESPYYDATLRQVDPDPAKAQQLLDELAADGKPLEFTIMTNPVQVGEAEWILGALQSFQNVTVDIDSVTRELHASRTFEKDYDASTSAQVWTDMDEGMANAFYTGRPGNYEGYSNPEVDRAFDRARQSQDDDVRADAFATIQEHVLSDLPAVYYIRQPLALVYRDSVEGLRLTGQRLPVWDEVSVDG